MKQTSLTGLLFGMLFFSISCHRGNSMIMISDGDYLSIHYAGDIRFNEEETAIDYISGNGFVRYVRNDKKLNAKNDGQGGIIYELYDNGHKLDYSSKEGKGLIAQAVKDMIDVGFDAKGRLDRIFKKAGSTAILDAVDQLKLDYVKAMYLDYLLELDTLQQEMYGKIANKIRTQIGDDYNKGKLLSKFPVNHLQDSVTCHAWFEAVKTINAAYEKTNALSYIIRQPMNQVQIAQVLDVSNSVNDDYDKSNILKELIFKKSIDEANFDKIADAVSYINSDYEKANLIKALLEKGKPSSEQFNKLLSITSHLNSDFDKMNLIREMMEYGIPKDADFDKMISAIVHTGSDFDKANLLKYMVGKNNLTNDQWIGIISAVSEISSDVDKSNLLIIIAPEMPKSDSVKTAYLRVAKTINTDGDLGRVLKAME